MKFLYILSPSVQPKEKCSVRLEILGTTQKWIGIVKLNYPPGSKCKALRLGVHLILLYFMSISLFTPEIIFLFGLGWGTFLSLNRLIIIWYIVQVYINLYPRGIRAEQNSYGFKNLEKLETNRIRNQQDLESSVLRNK